MKKITLILVYIFVFHNIYSLKAQTTVTSQITSSAADAEEIVSNGNVNTNSGVLEGFNSINGSQLVGMHFVDLGIPKGAIIDSTYIELVINNNNGGSAVFNVYAEASNNPQIWLANNQDISNRVKTNSFVQLTELDWVVYQSGSDYIARSYDLSPIIQEVVDRSGYLSQNATNIIVTRVSGGDGDFFSYDGSPSKSPKLSVTYNLDTQVPTASTLSSTTHADVTVDLSWTVATDNGTVTGYKVYKDGTLETTLGNVLNYQVTGLTAATTYSFTVTALDAAGNESAVSNMLSITTNATSGGGSGYWSLNNQSVYYNTGNVGIGTSTPDEKLAVNGNIHAQEVRVDLNDWPDYVFAKAYNLPTLKYVEEYIKENGHLPNIPSAKDVQENGILLGSMSAKLLEKIEELTLYIIQNDKRIEKLENQ